MADLIGGSHWLHAGGAPRPLRSETEQGWLCEATGFRDTGSWLGVSITDNLWEFGPLMQSLCSSFSHLFHTLVRIIQGPGLCTMSANTGEHTSTSPGNRQERGHEHGEAAVGRVHGIHIVSARRLEERRWLFPSHFFRCL